MARKDLLKKLMESDESAQATSAPARVDPAKPRYTSGAIGAVSRSIQDLKNRSLVDVDPEFIDDAGLTDRLDEMDTEMTSLIASIRQYGQQVPVLLRSHPEDPERFQIVYGAAQGTSDFYFGSARSGNDTQSR